MQQHTVTLEGETDWPGFRREAGAFLAHLVPPECVSWRTRRTPANERAAEGAVPATHSDPAGAGGMNPVVPRSFMSLCETVVLHEDPNRFALLYRLLWRLVHEPDLRHEPFDADRVRALHMAQAVRRDMQKMKSAVRFRAIDDGIAGEPLHAAWFEPAHHIVEAVAPFFVRRFTSMRWVILTPERSMRWNGQTLEFAAGAQREQAPRADAAATTWLVFCRSVFGPSQRRPATTVVMPAIAPG